jgi:hypothetical protein
MGLAHHPDPTAAASAAAAAAALLGEFEGLGTPRRGEEAPPGADGVGAPVGHAARGGAGNPRRRKKEAAAGDPFEGLECAKSLGPRAWLCEMAQAGTRPPSSVTAP